MLHYITAPLDGRAVETLRAGDRVMISGTVYAARDAAHKRMTDMLARGEELPLDVRGQLIYYVGPCPAKPGQVIGSAGPTTSSRMDAYAPALIELGLKGMIGKGLRNRAVIDAMCRWKAVYLGATGGAGALIARIIIHEEIVAFPELGPEALRKLTVQDFPAVVIIDAQGNNLYETGRAKFCKTVVKEGI